MKQKHNNKRGQFQLAALFGIIGWQAILALAVGIPLLLGGLKSVFFPAKTSTPPIWVIGLVVIIAFILLRKK